MTEIEITKASEVKVREIEWLWYPYIPFGKITVVQGDAGDGKSTFVLNLAAMLSRGQPMPFTDGTGQPPINIIYQSSEDDADDTIVPRFISAGGDPERLLFISERERYLSFSDERLIQAVRQTAQGSLSSTPSPPTSGRKQASMPPTRCGGSSAPSLRSPGNSGAPS